ncbi:DUF2179 domain-containing protein [Oceanirhabdus sp. W0125-5]|uniref:DUF2179 domain-containing protein n=1 Tax=Oceanirhabdus sp. W0125-5 TaxID=2999116 RepID=UPI0022F32F7D|nr:DUF5698 domain-containing protein [Oceanirhabdus sp. W0125-5]WBW97278.1 DUF5698 domain-containing protein [Oceanirhabdus sp. W0125-5]
MLLYLLILIVKIIEVTLGTVRIVFITKGERLIGAIIGFFEVIIWVIVISTVLKDVTEDPIKVFIYALGFALGNYVGSLVEEKLGVGTTRVEMIVKEEQGEALAENIRKNGFAVTVLEGQGMKCNRYVMISHVKRKRANEFIEMVKSYEDNVVITVNEIKAVYGGHGILKR